MNPANKIIFEWALVIDVDRNHVKVEIKCIVGFSVEKILKGETNEKKVVYLINDENCKDKMRVRVLLLAGI